MATAIFDSPIRYMEGTTKALSTTAGYIAPKIGFQEVKLYCPSPWRLGIAPRLVHCIYYDTSVGTYTEYLDYAIDGDSSTHVPLDAMATGDYLYLGTTEQTRGFYIDIGENAQATASRTLDVEYCSTAVAKGADIAWTNVADDSDGTNSGTTTLAVDGVYTFTLPSGKHSYLGSWAAKLFSKCYWIRFCPSGALSDPVDINEIIPIAKNTNYAYMEAGVEYQLSLNQAHVGGLEVSSVSGTPTLNITWIQY